MGILNTYYRLISNLKHFFTYTVHNFHFFINSRKLVSIQIFLLYNFNSIFFPSFFMYTFFNNSETSSETKTISKHKIQKIKDRSKCIIMLFTYLCASLLIYNQFVCISSFPFLCVVFSPFIIYPTKLFQKNIQIDVIFFSGSFKYVNEI